jgi:branched-chain amino acid transport system permease protein
MGKQMFGWSTAQAKAVDYYILTLIALAVFGAIKWWIVRSPWGRAFVALRENPVRAMSLGVDTRRYTLMAFAIGSAFAGFAGAVYAPLVQFIEPSSFSLGLSLSLLLMVIIGGSGTLVGPLLGALIAILAPEWLRVTEGYYLLLYAVLVMVMMVFCPQGLIGLVEKAVQRIRRGTQLAASAQASSNGSRS